MKKKFHTPTSWSRSRNLDIWLSRKSRFLDLDRLTGLWKKISFPISKILSHFHFISCYLRWTQVPRLFAVLFTMTTFCRPKWPQRLFAVFFWLLTKLEDKKGCATFCCPFGDFLASKTQKRTAKGHAAFFVLQKDAKKTPKGRRANFVLHLVGNLFWTPKGRLCKKDGKKSWHLHSAWVILSVAGVWLSLTYVWKPWCWE